MTRAVSLALLAGCRFQAGALPGAVADDAAAPDVAVIADARPDALAQIAHVQNVVAIGAGTSMTATFPNAVNAGDLLVGSFRGIGTPTVSDSLNGAWAPIYGANLMWLFYRANTKGAPAGGLAITVTAMTGNLRISADEFSGIATANAFDQYTESISTGDNTTWIAAPSMAIPAGRLVYAGGGTVTNDCAFTPGTTDGIAMTLGGQIANAANGSSFSEYLLASTAGIQNASAGACMNAGITGIQAIFRPAP